MKAQRGNQATLVSVIADKFCCKLSCGGGTCLVDSFFSKSFTCPENSISLSRASEGDFFQAAGISSSDTASQSDLI